MHLFTFQPERTMSLSCKVRLRMQVRLAAGYTSPTYSCKSVLDYHGQRMGYIPNIPCPANVKHLLLSDMNLTNILPSGFSNLRSLETLDLGRNFLTNIEPHVFAGTELWLVSLHNNNLSCVPDFTSMSSTLKRLRLFGNKIDVCNDRMACTTNYHELIMLYLGNNRLTRLPWICFRARAMRRLELQGNLLKVVSDIRPFSPLLNHLRLIGNPVFNGP